MARKDVVITVDTSRLERLLNRFPGNVDQAVRAVAFIIEEKAKDKAVVDTGAMRASIYTRTNRYDGFSAAAKEAREKASRKNRKLVLTELPAVREHEAVVGPSVNYAIDVEFGANGREARSFLGEAVRETTRQMAANFADAVDNSL